MKIVARFTLLLLVLLLTLVVTGCQPAQEAGGPAIVRVLAMEQAGPTVEEMNAIVAEFNETNPNVEVLIDYVAYDALHDKVTTAMASDPPAYDVFLVDDIWYAEFADKGYLLDATDRISQETKDNIFDAAWEISTVQGRIYGMPWLLDQKYFYYNEEILQQAGFDAPPRTWEELLDQARVIKEQGIVEYPIVWSWGQYEAAICDLVTLLYGNGGGLVDEAGNPIFNNAAGVAAMTWMVDTIDEGLTNPASISYVEEDVRNVFSQGRAAFANNWNYMFDLVNFNEDESQVTGKVKMALMPAFAGAGVESATIDGSMGFSVAANSPHKDAAWDYVAFLTSEDVQNRYSAHLLPVWETSFEGEAGQALINFSEVTAVTVPMFKEQFPFSHVRPKVPFYPEASKTLQLAMQEALTKQKTPQQALDDAAAKWVELAGN